MGTWTKTAAGLQVCLAFATLHPVLAAADVVEPIAVWGSHGSGPGEFDRPTSVATDADGNVYVADHGNSRVQKFTSTGTLILSWGNAGSGNGEFATLLGIAVGPDGSVFTTEDGTDRVQQFSSGGSFIRTWGSWGSCDGNLKSPSAIAVDASGDVYVSDAGNDRIQKFSDDGTFLTKWGSWPQSCDPGDWEGARLTALGGMSARDGNLIVGEPNQVHKYGSDGSDLGAFACCEFTLAGGLTTDGDGHVYVSNPYRDRVQVFSSTGTFIREFGGTGTGNGEFNWPGAIAVDAAGDIYVVDAGNHRVQKFANSVATASRPSTWGRVKVLYR